MVKLQRILTKEAIEWGTRFMAAFRCGLLAGFIFGLQVVDFELFTDFWVIVFGCRGLDMRVWGFSRVRLGFLMSIASPKGVTAMTRNY